MIAAWVAVELRTKMGYAGSVSVSLQTWVETGSMIVGMISEDRRYLMR